MAIKQIIILLLILLPTTFSLPRPKDISYYNTNDISAKTTMVKLLNAEYGGHSLQSKIHGASVIINRLQHPAYPKTIKEVIFQKNQFAGTKSKHFKVDETVNTLESIRAVDIVLKSGSQLPSNIIFFSNVPKIKNKKWYNKIKKKFVFKDDAHSYFTD